MFNTYQDLVDSDYRGCVSIRSKEGSSRFCKYLIPYDKVSECVDSFVKEGADRSLFTFNESAPDDELIFQGELGHSASGGYCLFGSTLPLPMRIALDKNGKQWYGLEAIGRVKYYCNDNSYEMIKGLIDLYLHEDVVIEFGCYSKNLGVMLGHNTIIWEVRKY
jgi:hypothetical protein